MESLDSFYETYDFEKGPVRTPYYGLRSATDRYYQTDQLYYLFSALSTLDQRYILIIWNKILVSRYMIIYGKAILEYCFNIIKDAISDR